MASDRTSRHASQEVEGGGGEVEIASMQVWTMVGVALKRAWQVEQRGITGGAAFDSAAVSFGLRYIIYTLYYTAAQRQRQLQSISKQIKLKISF